MRSYIFVLSLLSISVNPSAFANGASAAKCQFTLMSEQQLRTAIVELANPKSALEPQNRMQQLRLAANILAAQTSTMDPDVVAAFKVIRSLKEQSKNISNLLAPVISNTPVATHRYPNLAKINNSSRNRIDNYALLLAGLEIRIYPIFKSAFDLTPIAFLTTLTIEAHFPLNIKVAHHLNNKLFIHYKFSDLEKNNFKKLVQHIQMPDKPDGSKKSQGFIISPINAGKLNTRRTIFNDLDDQEEGLLDSMHNAFVTSDADLIQDISDLIKLDLEEELDAYNSERD